MRVCLFKARGFGVTKSGIFWEGFQEKIGWEQRVPDQKSKDLVAFAFSEDVLNGIRRGMESLSLLPVVKVFFFFPSRSSGIYSSK